MPATVTRTILKGYFDPGDEPTSVEFQTLVDSLASTNEANYLTGSMQITGSFDVAGENINCRCTVVPIIIE